MGLDSTQREHLILLEDYKHIFLENERGKRILQDLRRNFLYGSKENPIHSEGEEWGAPTFNDQISLGKRFGHMEVVHHIISICGVDPLEYFSEADKEEIQTFVDTTGKEQNDE